MSPSCAKLRRSSSATAQTLEFLPRHFGKVGAYYYWASHGIDERPVVANRIRKSVGPENTFPADLHPLRANRRFGARCYSIHRRLSLQVNE
jgi:nucleotidyltransferase/DNA polymerase involved in DNA repair